MDIKWDKEYETGVRLIDSQHKNFTSKLDNLVKAVKSGRGQIEIQKMIKFLEQYIESHFDLEEKYMRDYKYPQMEFHKDEHKKFRKFVKAINAEYSHQKTDSYFINYCRQEIWVYFVEHITVIDASMADFLKRKGAV